MSCRPASRRTAEWSTPRLDRREPDLLPSGRPGHAPTSSKPSAIVVFLPCRSTTLMPPRRSCRTGCSANAIRSPGGRDAQRADPACRFVEHLADRVFQPLTVRPASGRPPMSSPLGPQSASRKPSMTSRGAPPPSGSRAEHARAAWPGMRAAGVRPYFDIDAQRFPARRASGIRVLRAARCRACRGRPSQLRGVDDRPAVRRKTCAAPTDPRRKVSGSNVGCAASGAVGRTATPATTPAASSARPRDGPASSGAPLRRRRRQGLGRRCAAHRLEVESDVARGLEALLGALLEAVQDDAFERGRQVGGVIGQPRRVRLEDRAHRLDRRVAPGTPGVRRASRRARGRTRRCRSGGRPAAPRICSGDM